MEIAPADADNDTSEYEEDPNDEEEGEEGEGCDNEGSATDEEKQGGARDSLTDANGDVHPRGSVREGKDDDDAQDFDEIDADEEKQAISSAWFSIRNTVSVVSTYRQRFLELFEDVVTFSKFEGARPVGSYRLQSIEEMHLHFDEYHEYPFRVVLVMRNMAGFSRVIELFTRSPNARLFVQATARATEFTVLGEKAAQPLGVHGSMALYKRYASTQDSEDGKRLVPVKLTFGCLTCRVVIPGSTRWSRPWITRGRATWTSHRQRISRKVGTFGRRREIALA